MSQQDPAGHRRLGAQLTDEGCHFSLVAPRADRVELVLVGADRSQVNTDMSRTDRVWHCFAPGVKAGQRYGFRVHGDWDPAKGARFNPAKLLLDPYARSITAGVDYTGPILDHLPSTILEPDSQDSSMAVPLSVVVADSAPPRPVQRRPMTDCVIYETHVKGHTRRHPGVPEHLRGSFAGLAHPAVIKHLLETGINTVQLMPVQHFISEPFVIGRGLTNYWGYNTIGFFAPHASYCSVGTLGQQVTEFKDMVDTLHKAGIEVLLDVVYNHTAEGGHEGPTLSFRGIDQSNYYRLSNDLGSDYDVTGCGNSLDTSHDDALRLIIDSMRYWVTEMGVDGFRFDLATTLIRNAAHHVDQNHEFKRLLAEDPDFEGIKLIAEPWDLGPYGYQVGRWGPGWSEHNDRFRNFVRDYWRGAVSGVQELATRLSGSPDLFDDSHRTLGDVVNFVAVHDGFTTRDVVTYDVKHNEANGESNRDGSDDNRSWNCGWEGETTDPAIVALRHQQVRNLMATVILAGGVPMILAGDEIGRTQQGNNNAYCQDTQISWTDWTQQDQWNDVLELTSTLLRLRAEHPILRSVHFRHHKEVIGANGVGLGRADLTWMDGDVGEMGEDSWHDPTRRHLGMYVSDADEAFLIWFHSGPGPVEVVLPARPWGNAYEVVGSTAEPGAFAPEVLLPGDRLMLPGRSVVVMEVSVVSSQHPVEEDADTPPTATPVAHSPAEPTVEDLPATD